MSQINLQHGTTTVESSKTKKKKTDMLRSIGKQSVESVSQSERRKGMLRWKGFAEKESFKPKVEE